METLNFDWLSFSVNLELVRAWIDTNITSATCLGISADSKLKLHFDAKPSDADITAFEDYYNSLDETSDEATKYIDQASVISAIDTLRAGLDPNKTWDQLSVNERKLILGQELTAEDLGLI